MTPTRSEQPRVLFELLGKDDGKGGHVPIRGCKTNSKGVVVEGVFRAVLCNKTERKIEG